MTSITTKLRSVNGVLFERRKVQSPAGRLQNLLAEKASIDDIIQQFYLLAFRPLANHSGLDVLACPAYRFVGRAAHPASWKIFCGVCSTAMNLSQMNRDSYQ